MSNRVTKKYSTIVLTVLIPMAIILFILYYSLYYSREVYNVYKDEFITLWDGYVIFEQYTSPFPPTNNYIYIYGNNENKLLFLGVTKYNSIGILCSDKIAHKISKYKNIDIFDNQNNDWAVNCSQWCEKYLYDSLDVLYNVHIISISGNRNMIMDVTYLQEDSIIVSKNYISPWPGENVERHSYYRYDTIRKSDKY